MDAYMNFEYTGAMTRSFIDVLTESQEQPQENQDSNNANNTTKEMSWKLLIEKMRTYLKSRNFDQVPQLTCGKKIDMSKINVNF